MAFCTNCGKQLPENSRFCPYCGVPVSGGNAKPANRFIATPYSTAEIMNEIEAKADPGSAAGNSRPRAAAASASTRSWEDQNPYAQGEAALAPQPAPVSYQERFAAQRPTYTHQAKAQSSPAAEEYDDDIRASGQTEQYAPRREQPSQSYREPTGYDQHYSSGEVSGFSQSLPMDSRGFTAQNITGYSQQFTTATGGMSPTEAELMAQRSYYDGSYNDEEENLDYDPFEDEADDESGHGLRIAIWVVVGLLIVAVSAAIFLLLDPLHLLSGESSSDTETPAVVETQAPEQEAEAVVPEETPVVEATPEPTPEPTQEPEQISTADMQNVLSAYYQGYLKSINNQDMSNMVNSTDTNNDRMKSRVTSSANANNLYDENNFTVTIDDASIVYDGDSRVVLNATFDFSYSPRDDSGSSQTATNHQTIELVKGDDGSWKVNRCAFVSDAEFADHTLANLD